MHRLNHSFFSALEKSSSFEPLGSGRFGCIQVDYDPSDTGKDRVPIVRSTSRYQRAAQCYSPAIRELQSQICELPDLKEEGMRFNNAMIEMYTTQYRTMRFHSDQALDLDPDSSIAIYSCYDDEAMRRAEGVVGAGGERMGTEGASPSGLRRLVIQKKAPTEHEDQDEGQGAEDPEDLQEIEIIMEHNSVIVFSVETNRMFRHKIVLADEDDRGPGLWIGVTFRLSKTFIDPGCPEIHLASKEEEKEFFRLRGMENALVDFVYDDNVDVTISRSDLLVPNDSASF